MQRHLSKEVRWRKEQERSDDQTGFKQTSKLAELIWRRKFRQTVKLLPEVSAVNIHPSLGTNLLANLFCSFLCDEALLPTFLVHSLSVLPSNKVS